MRLLRSFFFFFSYKILKIYVPDIYLCILVFIYFQLLDLFALNAGDKDKNDFSSSASSKKSNTVNEFMKSLPELWDSKDYEEEYDMSSFISSLRQ